MAWTAPRTWVTSEVVTAAVMNTHVRDNLLEAAPAKASGAGQIFVSTAANALAARTLGYDTVTTSETTTSTSYTNIATTGPAVTLTISTTAAVFFQCQLSNSSAGETAAVSVAVSGSSSVSASDQAALSFESSAANDRAQFGTVFRFSALTAGSNTFTMQYRVTGGTGTFSQRRLLVIPL